MRTGTNSVRPRRCENVAAALAVMDRVHGRRFTRKPLQHRTRKEKRANQSSHRVSGQSQNGHGTDATDR